MHFRAGEISTRRHVHCAGGTTRNSRGDRRKVSPRRQARGVTLVEVLGALALLGTLLVWLIVGQARLVRQTGRAQRKIEAVKIADQLLTTWWQNRTNFPYQGSGPAGPDLIWQTRIIERPELTALGAEVVRLDIVDQRPEAAGTSLTSVEVVLPKPVAADSP